MRSPRTLVNRAKATSPTGTGKAPWIRVLSMRHARIAPLAARPVGVPASQREATETESQSVTVTVVSFTNGSPTSGVTVTFTVVLAGIAPFAVAGPNDASPLLSVFFESTTPHQYFTVILAPSTPTSLHLTVTLAVTLYTLPGGGETREAAAVATIVMSARLQLTSPMVTEGGVPLGQPASRSRLDTTAADILCIRFSLPGCQDVREARPSSQPGRPEP